nr:hypothetical protein [Tanacetum cinerariifolium]
RPNSTVVEIQPPTSLMKHRGFKNMAQFLGHRYFREHGHPHEYEGKPANPHNAIVFIEEGRFVGVMEKAIASMSG